ncbi:MAG TPA: type II secretion system protein [Gemmatimonadales bacterium]|jgi:prepilin-type N-terminal cleavage/methylation domain-containing protein|nr:type II secretion system protein [Gemmatimonadales bacterium]
MNRKGFTLIELLIVVVIIGILAAIAIPKFANTKEKAYLASMKSDLRNLVTAQESYFSDYQVYTAGTGSNIGGVGSSTPANFFVPSAGVTVNFTAGTPAGAGWQASATHSGLPAGRLCAIFAGSSPGVIAPATNEGEPKCN